MTSPTPTVTLTSARATSAASDRFTLDPKAATAFLKWIRRTWSGGELPARPAAEAGSCWPGWEPRELRDDDMFHLESLIGAAVITGVVVPPAGWDVRLLTTYDPDGVGAWYQWQLSYCAAGYDPRTLGFAITSESLEPLEIIGRHGAKGTRAVLAVLREAVEYGNQLLEAYVEAAGRMSLPVLTDAATHSYGPMADDRPDAHGMVPRDGR